MDMRCHDRSDAGQRDAERQGVQPPVAAVGLVKALCEDDAADHQLETEGGRGEPHVPTHQGDPPDDREEQDGDHQGADALSIGLPGGRPDLGESDGEHAHVRNEGAADEMRCYEQSGGSSHLTTNIGTAADVNRTYVLYSSSATRVPKRALQVGAQPGPGHAVQVVAEPVHGLRPPLHVLLCPQLRAARRPAVRRQLWALDPGQDERRRGARP
jgi:hypothetical protein